MGKNSSPGGSFLSSRRRKAIHGICLLSLSLCASLLAAACSQPTAPHSPAATTLPEHYFENPVLRSDFPDPFVLRVGGVYYAYATNAAGKNVQVARSSDLVHWDLLNDALPSLPSWVQTDNASVWAPEVIQIGNTYVMYYTARDRQSSRQCIGVATSDRPEGKFKDRNDHALICQVDQGGSIDPSPLRDGERLYLYFKNDGNCCSMSTHLYVQQLTSDGLSLTGQPIPLIQNDEIWEGRVVEAPTMFKHENAYYLFFSGNDYAGVNYAVGYALCQSATGPCKQAPENPILTSQVKRRPQVIGPGGQALIQVGKQTWMVYHAWDVTSDGQRGDSRFMYLDRVDWQNGRPHVQGPTTTPQPMP